MAVNFPNRRAGAAGLGTRGRDPQPPGDLPVSYTPSVTLQGSSSVSATPTLIPAP